MSRLAIAVPLLAALAAGAALLWRRGEPSEVVAPAAPAPAAVEQPPPEPPKVEAAALPVRPATAVETDRRKQLELPDGTFVDALNGAEDCAPLAKYWGADWPWSPIVGVERSSAGIDWYRHADGSYSTTQMVWRSDLKRYDAMTRVAHPGPAAPAIGGAGR